MHVILAYRWFCGLGPEGDLPDQSIFLKNRHGRFRDSDLLRRLFERTVSRCMAEELVDGECFAVDASLIHANASRQSGGPGSDGMPPDADNRAVREYLAARRCGVRRGDAGGVEISGTRRSRLALDQRASPHGFLRLFDQLADRSRPRRHQGRGGERGIHPHIRVFDKSARRDGPFERDPFTYDQRNESYACPDGKRLRARNRNFATARGDVGQDGFIRYCARQQDCTGCVLRQRCTPNMPARKVTRSIHEGTR